MALVPTVHRKHENGTGRPSSRLDKHVHFDLDSLRLVLLLLRLQRQLDEELLQLLVAVVDAELLEAKVGKGHREVSRVTSFLRENRTRLPVTCLC